MNNLLSAPLNQSSNLRSLCWIFRLARLWRDWIGPGGFAITASGHFPEARFTGFEISSGALLVSLMRHYIERTDYRENLEFIQTDAFDIAKESGGTRFDKVFSNYPLSMRFQFSGIGKSYYESLQDRLVQPSLFSFGALGLQYGDLGSNGKPLQPAKGSAS